MNGDVYTYMILFSFIFFPQLGQVRPVGGLFGWFERKFR